MKQAFRILTVPTKGPGLYEFTGAIQEFVRGEGIENGLLTCFVRHTSASLLIQENADPDVQSDLRDFFAHLATNGMHYRHTVEGPDDMPSHIRAALTQTQVSIPVARGNLMLGTWQAVYVYEHRHVAHTRKVVLHFTGE